MFYCTEDMLGFVSGAEHADKQGRSDATDKASSSPFLPSDKKQCLHKSSDLQPDALIQGYKDLLT